MSLAVSKDRAGIYAYTFIHYPEAPGLPYGRAESSGQGRRESEFDELCFSGSVSCLYTKETELDILKFLASDKTVCDAECAFNFKGKKIFADQFYIAKLPCVASFCRSFLEPVSR